MKRIKTKHIMSWNWSEFFLLKHSKVHFGHFLLLLPSATRWWLSAGTPIPSGVPRSPSWCRASPPSSPVLAGSTTSCSTPPTSTSRRWTPTPPSSPPPTWPLPPPPSHLTPPPPRPYPPSQTSAAWSVNAAPDWGQQRERRERWRQWWDEKLLYGLTKHWTLCWEETHSFDCSINVNRSLQPTFVTVP